VQEPDNINRAEIDEAVAICRRILEDCVTDEIRYYTKETLCYIYSEYLKEPQKALEIADSMPKLFHSSNILKRNILKGHMKLKQSQENIELMTDLLYFDILEIADINCENGNDIPVKVKIQIVEKSIKLLELIYDDGVYNFYEVRMANSYGKIAYLYLLENDYDKALENLEKMAEHAVKYDLLPAKQNYSAVLVDRLVFDKNVYHAVTTHNESYRILNSYLPQKIYDPIRETKRFKAIVAKLKQHAR